jgi:hypothetical protein
MVFLYQKCILKTINNNKEVVRFLLPLKLYIETNLLNIMRKIDF